MEVKIGVQFAPRELVLETNTSAEDVEKHLAEVITSGGVLTITDVKGRTIAVPADKVAYVELGAPKSGTVGFR